MATGATRNVDTQPNAILIVINQQFDHFLYQAAGCAFMPDRLPAAAEIMRFCCFDGTGQGLCVHVSVHQQFAGLKVRGYGRDQPI